MCPDGRVRIQPVHGRLAGSAHHAGSEDRERHGQGALIEPALAGEDEIAALIQRGEILAAYDIARAALETGGASRQVAYKAVLCLARAGAADFARTEYVRLGLDRVDDDPDVIALGARLLKDVALAARGPRRTAFARASARRYQALFQRFGGLYGAINAATMTLVAGDHARARALAEALGTSPPPAPGLKGEAAYYEGASRAEALFLTGRLEEARETLAEAMVCAPRAFAAHASTLRQLDMLCGETGVDTAWLTPFRPPACAHFTGHILDAAREGALTDGLEGDLRDEADRMVREQGIGFAYGGLAAGADIVFAEALLAAGAELHLVLPVSLESFVAVSVSPFGPAWRERFERCFARATSVRYASPDPYAGDEQVFAYGSQIAMGCAVLRAQTLSTEAVQVAVWDGHPAAGPAGVAVDLAYWAQGRRRQLVISVRRPPPPVTDSSGQGRDGAATRAMKAMLFADVKGFGALRDDQIPAFIEAVMGQMAKVVESLEAGPRHIETWGDGLFLVFDQPIDAAIAALALQEAHRALDLRGLGLPRSLGLRIGGHYGPVHLTTNPLTKTPAVVGAHVVVAARIEPEVAPGSAGVSEALAGALATFHGDRVRCGYVGRTQGRKDFPATPIFNLARV